MTFGTRNMLIMYVGRDCSIDLMNTSLLAFESFSPLQEINFAVILVTRKSNISQGEWLTKVGKLRYLLLLTSAPIPSSCLYLIHSYSSIPLEKTIKDFFKLIACLVAASYQLSMSWIALNSCVLALPKIKLSSANKYGIHLGQSKQSWYHEFDPPIMSV